MSCISDHSVYITGAAAVTPLGDLEQTWQALMEGRSALHPLNPRLREAFAFSGPAGSVTGTGQGCTGWNRLEILLDRLYDQLGHVQPLPQGTGLVLATTKGAVDELRRARDIPSLSMPGQPWNLADEISSHLDLSGPVSTVSAACASGTVAIIQAAARILAGEAPAMLVVGVDVLSRFVLNGFAGLQALSHTVCRPFDRHRDGLVLGEGAAVVLLSRNEPAKNAGEESMPLGLLAGWGISCDAVHITAPDRDARGLVAAVRSATLDVTRTVGAINAHGTATVYNDAMELQAFRQIWHTGETPVFHSVKGSMGHCLGAAGVIEACMALKSLEAGFIPPTAGLREPQEQGMNASGDTALPLAHQSVLSCNSGFGGINAAILLEGHGSPIH